jgi:hypothetical protein
MNEKRGTMPAVFLLAGVIAAVIFIINLIIGTQRIVSPVPDEGAIKIIYLTPVPTVGTTATPETKPLNTGLPGI